MSKWRVCYFIERWSSGGIEAFIANMLTAAAPLSVSVDIVAESLEYSIYTERLQALGARFFELSGRLRSPKNKRLFRELLLSRGYSAVHLHIFHGMSLEYAKIARRVGIKTVIAHCHGAGLRKSPTRPVKMLLHRLGRLLFGKYATERIACSRAAGEFLFAKRDFRIINNGIKTDAFRFDPERRSLVRDELSLNGSPVLGHIGRLAPEKNHEFLLLVFREYKRLHENAKFIIIGDGELEGKIKERARELAIYDDICFIGLTDRVPELLFAMDGFIFPSFSEGLGIAAIEAVATGLPLLTSLGVPSEVRFTERSAALPLGDAAAWAREIDRLIAIPKDRERGADTVKAAGFDSCDAARELMSLYADGAPDA